MFLTKQFPDHTLFILFPAILPPVLPGFLYRGRGNPLALEILFNASSAAAVLMIGDIIPENLRCCVAAQA